MSRTIYNVADRDIYETMKEEAREAIIEALEDNYSGYYCDLHNEVFNTDYYRSIEPTSVHAQIKAKALLGDNVFDAIGRIYQYEKDVFGEVCTDLSNPARVINMLYYIVGEEILMNEVYEILDEHWDNVADDEINKKIIKKLTFNK